MRDPMQKVEKIKGAAAKRVAAGCLTAKAAKPKNGKINKSACPPPPFAHRTPTQLHASTYALKRS
jgi:hypothetical protein